jgi:hypothetical protein
VVMMIAVSISSPFGPIQVSHSPAKAIGPPSRGRAHAIGAFAVSYPGGSWVKL